MTAIRWLENGGEQTGAKKEGEKETPTKATTPAAPGTPAKAGEGLRERDDRANGKLAIYLKITDVTVHEKPNKDSIHLFGEIKGDDHKRVGTINININNLGDAGKLKIGRTLADYPTRGLPMVMEMFVPTGEILDHYNAEIATQEPEPKKEAPEAEEKQ